MNKLFEILEKHLMGPLSSLANLRIIRAPVVAGGRVTVRVEQIGGAA